MAACFIRFIVLRSLQDCHKPPSGWIQKYAANAVAIFKEQSQSLIKKAADKLKIFREKVFKKWSKVTDYLKQKSTDTWENVGQMFEQLDKESRNITAHSFTTSTDTKKSTCVPIAIAAYVAHTSTDAPSGFSAGICPSLSDQKTPTFAHTDQKNTTWKSLRSSRSMSTGVPLRLRSAQRTGDRSYFATTQTSALICLIWRVSFVPFA